MDELIKENFSPDSSVGKESAYNSGDPGLIPGSGRSTGEGIGYPLQYSWASLVAQLVKNLPTMRETWVGKILWRRERLSTPVFWPGELHGLYSPWGAESRTRLSNFHSLKLKRCVLKNESINFQCNLTNFRYKGKNLISIQVKTKNRFLRKNTTMKPASRPLINYKPQVSGRWPYRGYRL